MIEKAIRLEILRQYYNLYKSDPDSKYDCAELMNSFGINKSELRGHILYLHDKGLLKGYMSLQGGLNCRITHKGIDALENPEQFLYDIPFLNLIIHGDVTNSTITQAKEIKIINGFNQIYQTIEKSDLAQENKDELLKDIKDLESEGNKKNPNLGTIKSLLDKVKKIWPPIYDLLKPLIEAYMKKQLGLD